MPDRQAARLPHFPVSLFASVMGVGGLSLAWRRAAGVLSWPVAVAQGLFWAAAALFLGLLVVYLAKWVKHPEAARAELRHPIRMAFVPTITIAILILATAGQDLMPPVAKVAWWVGAIGHLALTAVTLSAWFTRRDIGAGMITPAWFIPVVGNVITPLAAPTLGSMELAWFAFGVGMTFWVALLPLLLQRVLTHEQPLAPKLTPTLAIFVAPPAVAMLSWQSLTGRLDDPPARILFSAALGFLVLLALQLPLLRTIPFAVPAWAYTFPLAAAAAATLAVAGDRHQAFSTALAIAVLALATVVVTGVAVLTGRAALRGQICIPE